VTWLAEHAAGLVWTLLAVAFLVAVAASAFRHRHTIDARYRADTDALINRVLPKQQAAALWLQQKEELRQ